MEEGPRFQGRLSAGFLQRKLGELLLVQSLMEGLSGLDLDTYAVGSWEHQVLASEDQGRVCVPP